MAPQIVANDAAHEPHPSESLQSTDDGGTGQVFVDATYWLQREFLRIEAKDDREDFLHELAVALQVHTDAIWVALIHTNGSQIIELSGNALNYAHFKLTCEDAAACALQTQSATYRKLVGAPNAQLVAVPITGQAGECLLATVPDVASDAISLGAFDLAAAHIAFWNENRQRAASEAESQRVAALTELVSMVGFASSAKKACQIIANDLQAYLNCQEVIVGLCQRHDAACEVMAISGARSVDTKSDRTRLAEAALQECIVRDGQSTWPPVDAQDRHALCAHRLFSQANDQVALVSMPLRDDVGHSLGAWLIIGDANTVHHERAMTFLQAAEQPLASTIGLLLRAKGNPLEQWVRSAAALAREQKGKAALLIAMLVFAILLIPVRYRVSCDCELQPVVRRYIAAPFDGRLEKI